MTSYQPRPYQKECMAALATARASGVKKGLVVMASGLGKTLTIIFDLQQFLQEHPNARILYLCHQEPILAQSKAKFKKVFGDECSYGMFTGHHKTARAVTFLFATFQTMCDHREKFAADAFDYVIVDEAHHTSAETYQPTVDYFTPQFLIGLTATKDRMDGQDILETYEQIIYQMDIYDGWAQGWLACVDYRIMLDDLKQEEFEKYVGPHATTEKVSLAQLNKTIFAPQHDEGIMASIREQTADLDDPRIFVFCPSVEHANAMAHCFEGEAAVMHSGQSYGANQAVLSKFRAGKIRIIISVDMLNEGIDVPETGVVVFLRSTESAKVFFQQLGRGLRLGKQKRTVRVLDYVANIERISTVLEMETTTKERLTSSLTYAPSVNKPEPLVINIPATKFKVEKVDVERLLEKLIERRVGMFTKEEVIRTLQDYAREHNTTKLCHIDVRPLYSWATLKRLFGGCQQAIEAAGLEYYRIPNSWTRETIIKSLQENAKDGKMPSASEIKNNQCYPGPSTIKKYFSSWQELADAAGLTIDTKKASDEDMLKAYLEASVAAGKWLGREGIDAHPDLSSSCVYRRRFGNLSRLPELATQLEPNRPGLALLRPTNGLYSQAIIEDRIHAFIRTNHRLPTTVDFRTDETLPAYQVCYKRYRVKSLPKLLEMCHAQQVLDEVGEERAPAEPVFTESDIQAIRELALRLGRRLKVRDLRPANGTKSYGCFRKHKISLDEINRMANVDQILAELKEKENN